MTRLVRWLVAIGLAAGAAPSPGAAQDHPLVGQAQAAYDGLNYAQAIQLASRALRDRLGSAEQVRVYQLLGFSYASLDSTRQATDAFKQLLLLAPDHRLDERRISPKITGLFALAAGQVLVIRDLRVDTGAFVAVRESLVVRFGLTRPARVVTRVIGPGGQAVLDSTLREGEVVVGWNGLLDGLPPREPGEFRIVVDAAAGRDRYARAQSVRVTPSPVDTLPHLRALPGYTLLPERVVPPRSWRPIGFAFLGTAIAAGAALALENGALGDGGARRELITIGAGAVLVGLLATARKPAPVPAEGNILYNQLVREQLARQNADIAAQNAGRRLLVRLAVTAVPGAAGP